MAFSSKAFRMFNPTRILVYGRDPSLLETRQLVLQTIGGTVEATTELEQAKRMLGDGSLDLLVLCYTLSLEDRNAILNSVEQLSPDLKVLILSADGPPSNQTVDGDFSIFSGPGAFKSKVLRMLGSEEQVAP